ncbi:MAG TPA: DNA-binding domain-containing protein [Methylococcaceae bacterium]|nr:DNA-binding domain-containing protein [Methylococcaceae bacterium]
MRLNTATSLAELQRRFQTAILSGAGTAPEFVAAASANDAELRFRIYRDAYRLRLAEALAADYPALQVLLGAKAFADLACAYAESRPSRHYSIRWAGAGLAEFLGDRADLADLARFEWALSEAFDAKDATPLDAAALSTLPVEQWPKLRLSFHPSLRSIVLNYSAAELWRAIREGEPSPSLAEEAEAKDWLVWRRGLAIYYRPLGEGEAWALDAAGNDTVFADWCEGLSRMPDGATDAAATAANLLHRWVADGLIVGVSGSDSFGGRSLAGKSRG